MTNRVCSAGKGYECLSDHIMLKHIPLSHQISASFRVKERLETVRALCRYDRFIWLHYLLGDTKESIANWCVRYVVERKVFTGAVL